MLETISEKFSTKRRKSQFQLEIWEEFSNFQTFQCVVCRIDQWTHFPTFLWHKALFWDWKSFQKSTQKIFPPLKVPLILSTHLRPEKPKLSPKISNFPDTFQSDTSTRLVLDALWTTFPMWNHMTEAPWFNCFKMFSYSWLTQFAYNSSFTQKW